MSKVPITRNKASISKYYCKSLLWNENLWFTMLTIHILPHTFWRLDVKRSSFVLLLRKSGNRDDRYFWQDH